MKIADMVIDMQFGSTGKGALVGYLANQHVYDTVVAAWGPNAGHTFIDEFGTEYINTMLPIAAVVPGVRHVLLGPGSVLNLDNLVKEIDVAVTTAPRPLEFTLVIHPQAMVVYDRHRDAERELVRVGSTMKGTGAALLEKIKRDQAYSPLVRDVVDRWDWSEFAFRCGKAGIRVKVDEQLYGDVVDGSKRMMIEGAQGFSLGLNRQFWPNTTSREITPAMMLADCALPVPVRYSLNIYGTLRTFPIRVANRFDEHGNQIGSSGGCYPDQHELTWEDIGQKPELTTVTKLQRRVFSFSYEQLREALRLCTPNFLFLNFANYLAKRHDKDAPELDRLIWKINEEAKAAGCAYGIRYLGWGPGIGDIEEI